MRQIYEANLVYFQLKQCVRVCLCVCLFKVCLSLFMYVSVCVVKVYVLVCTLQGKIYWPTNYKICSTTLNAILEYSKYEADI